MSLLLSICIPTYNRADYLAQTLESILAQATEQVEIVISDNASTDHTEEVVRGYQERFERLTYARQTENVGRDRNYLKSVALAKGKYCWLLGDDDLLTDGSIAHLLPYLLSEVPPDFVLLTGTVYDSTLTHIISESATEIGVSGDIRTTDLLDFFSRFFCESGLSVYVVNREEWNRVSPGKYVGTGLVYLAVVYEYLKIGSPLQVVARPCIKYRSGNASWSSGTLDILIGQMNYVITNLPARYDPAKADAMVRLRARIPVTVIMLAGLRAQGYYDLALYRKYVAPYFSTDIKSRNLAALIAFLPISMLKVAQYFHRKGKTRASSSA